MSANAIAECMFAQVDHDGSRLLLLDEIIDHRSTKDAITQTDAFVNATNGRRRRKQTTKGWEFLMKWKDGSETWVPLKDVKESFPMQVAEFSVQVRIQDEPAFAWWVPHVLKKRSQIIAKVKSKYWQRTHKFGIRIPKSIREALKVDAENGNTLWWDAIVLEMSNVKVAFEEYDGGLTQDGKPKGYKYVSTHMLFDVKLGENYRRKARLVADGHKTETPTTTITYSSVVSRDSVRIALTIAVLNDLKIFACDIQNAFLTAPCREKLYTVAGPEFGSDEGKVMIIVRALYGLKSAGATFRAFLGEHSYNLGFRSSKADPDVWLRPRT
jgi:Reverse transcriptase (RNA-dependent DNA polymerase)